MTRPKAIHRSYLERVANEFDADLYALIVRAQNGKDLRWVPVCLWLLEARKSLAPMMKPQDVREMA